MSLSEEYRRQFSWRDWPRALDALPSLQGMSVLDLGCGAGDLSAEMAARGARVIGLELNEELLGEARSRSIPGARFHACDLRHLPDFGPVDGIWSSFAAAYFPDLAPVLASWARQLRSGGWIALTEVDDLFGHEPLSALAKSRFAAYARDALQTGRYDFHMGGKLRGHLEEGGFGVSKSLALQDRELSFEGPALPEVCDAWRARFERMPLLRDLCGSHFEAARDEFLGCLTHPDHRSLAKVHFLLASRGAA